MPAYEVDGHDFFAVWEAAREAIERARNGGGPIAAPRQAQPLLRPFRGRRDHLQAPGEVEKVKAEKDCLMLFRQRVTEAGLLEAPPMDAIDREVKADIDQALAEAKAAPSPTEADLLTDVYASAY